MICGGDKLIMIKEIFNILVWRSLGIYKTN